MNTKKNKMVNLISFDTAYEISKKYIEYLKKDKRIVDISVAGSIRRKKDEIGDIDIVASSNLRTDVINHFINYDEIKKRLVAGETKACVILKNDIQVDLRVVIPECYGAALQYFTGSKEHNILLRHIAKDKGLKLNEYGLYNINAKKYIAGKNEIEIYTKLGLSYIEPRFREYPINKFLILKKQNDTIIKMLIKIGSLVEK